MEYSRSITGSFYLERIHQGINVELIQKYVANDLQSLLDTIDGNNSGYRCSTCDAGV